MYATPQRQIDDALGKFDLIGGQGNGTTTACAMTMLGWLAGHKKWSDKPVCANKSLAEDVISANDETDNLPRDPVTFELTPASERKMKARRANLVKLGYEGVLDTWWIPPEIIEWARDTGEKDPYKHAVAMLKRIIKWKKTRHKMERVPTTTAKRFDIKYDENVGGFARLKGAGVWQRVS